MIVRAAKRDGMTLLEVLIALAVFLMAIAAISQLMGVATEMAEQVQRQSRAGQLAESKLNEFVAGVETIGGTTSGTFDEDPDWNWSVSDESDSLAVGLHKITVTVTRTFSDTRTTSASLTQYLLDATQRGNLSSSTAATTTGTTTSTATGSTSP